MTITPWRLIPLIVFTLLLGFFWHALSLDPRKLPSTQLDKPLPSFRLSTLGDNQLVLTDKSLKGQVSLLNVWASWCEACTEEQVFLMELARTGVVIYGLNYKDRHEAAIEWLGVWGNPYRLVGQDIHGHVGMDLGVYGTPETFLIDNAGIVRYRHVGILTANDWKRDFLPRIRALEKIA